MSDLRQRLEREMARIPPPTYAIDAVDRVRRRRQRNQRLGGALAGLAVAAIGAAVIAQAIPGSDVRLGPPPAGRLAFVSPGGGDARDRLFVAAPDGSGLTRVANIHAEYPEWSPDGTAIAFDDGRNLNGSPFAESPNGHIWIVQSDGTGLRQVPFDGDAAAPSWSPGSDRLAVAARQGPAAPGIAWLDPASGSIEWITRNPFEGYRDAEPDVSRDGSRVVFVRIRKLESLGGARNLAALFVVNADGSGLRRLTPWTADAGTPSWSPDGQRIAFDAADHDPAHAEIQLIDDDGSHRTRLMPSSTSPPAFWPTWSPDGSRILFSWLPGGDLPAPRLGSVPADGGELRPVKIRGAANQADWGPSR